MCTWERTDERACRDWPARCDVRLPQDLGDDRSQESVEFLRPLEHWVVAHVEHDDGVRRSLYFLPGGAVGGASCENTSTGHKLNRSNPLGTGCR